MSRDDADLTPGQSGRNQHLAIDGLPRFSPAHDPELKSLASARPRILMIGFFMLVAWIDHMLEQIAKHGGIGLELQCEGDLEVDSHHTIEDCALALGAALKQALGAKKGIARYGFTLPMDESVAEAIIDLSGRPYSQFEGKLPSTLLGQYPTEMTAHVFRSLADSLGAAIHIRVKGENVHHIVEACFKAFGRALRQAVARKEGDTIPSTKGSL